MLSYLDSFLNRITMYRLVLYYLIVVLATGGVLSVFGLFPFTLPNLLFYYPIIALY